MSTANKIVLVSDRVGRAKSYLLSQFKDKPNINALVDALVSELQELENVINDLQIARTLEGAYGWWLDQIGNDLDVTRGNYGDSDYKTAIKIAMARQTSSATINDILHIVSLITSDSEAVINNDSHYLLELYSYFFCVSESVDGLYNLASLFPLNTRVRFVKHDINPFTFNKVGAGFGDGQMCSLILSKNGIIDDSRFVSTPTQDLPPAITSVPSIVTNPYIYGSGEVGNTLNLVVGEYDGDDPLTITAQWLLDGNDIVGATGTSYLLVTGDAGKVISAAVTVTNAFGQIIAYSNTIVVSSVIPTPSPLVSGIGLVDHYTSMLNGTTSPVTNDSVIKFKHDGTLEYINNTTVLSTANFLTTTGSHSADGFKVSYEIVSGSPLIGLNPNASWVLDTDISVSVSLTSRYDANKAGSYRFTITKISDPTIYESKTIYISSEIIADVL